MRITLGYPDERAERALLLGDSRRDLLAQQEALLSHQELVAAQDAVRRVAVSEPLIDYVQALVQASRRDDALACGLSPRAALALLEAGRAWAWLAGRDMVVPDDIQTVFPSVAGHRLILAASNRPDPQSAMRLLAQVQIP
jgi:MoxR-like ATPase